MLRGRLSQVGRIYSDLEHVRVLSVLILCFDIRALVDLHYENILVLFYFLAALGSVCGPGLGQVVFAMGDEQLAHLVCKFLTGEVHALSPISPFRWVHPHRLKREQKISYLLDC